MDIHRRAFVGSGLALIAASAASAQEWDSRAGPVEGDPHAPFWPPRERVPLWPGTPPGAPTKRIVPNWTMNNPPPHRELWIRGVPFPELHVFRPARADGSALLSLPGGGYQFLSVQNEGLDVAQFFNDQRTTVFVLTYRLPGEGWANRSIVPLADAQRAMRLIRSRAAEFSIDPARLGAVGFSAGGHLAADLGVSFDERVYAPVDAADKLSARPAYLGLVYPVTTLVKARYDGRDWDGLTGPGSSASQLEARSPVLRIGKQTPPSFLVHTVDDRTVPVWHSFNWAGKLMNQGTAAELHVFSSGGHGFGLHLPNDNPGSHWPELFALWMRKNGG